MAGQASLFLRCVWSRLIILIPKDANMGFPINYYTADWCNSHRLAYKVVVVDLLFNVHGKHLRSCRDGQLT